MSRCWREKQREVALEARWPLRDESGYNRNCFDNCDVEDFNAFLRSARCRKARGYFGAADCLRDFEIFRSASVLFPINRSQVERENERRVTNVKGAERISFSVRHAAFLLSSQYRER